MDSRMSAAFPVMVTLGIILIVLSHHHVYSTRCTDRKPVFTAAVYVYRPLTNDARKNRTRGVMVTALGEALHICCNPETKIQVEWTGESAGDLSSYLIPKMKQNFALPLSRDAVSLAIDRIIPDQTFIPVIHTPGPKLVVSKRLRSNVMTQSVLATWPLLLVTITSAGIAGIIVWASDRYWNPEEFPKSFIKGYWEGIWWAIVTMTTVGYGDRTPRSVPARIFGLLWIITGIVIMGVFTAALSSALTFENGRTYNDLTGLTVGVVNGSEEMAVALQRGANFMSFSTPRQMLKNVARNEELDGGLIGTYTYLSMTDFIENLDIRLGGTIYSPAMDGVLVTGLDQNLTKCLASSLHALRFDIYKNVMDRIGRIKTRSGDMSSYKTHQLLSEQMAVVYGVMGFLVLLITILLVWEFAFWRRGTNSVQQDSRVDKEADSEVQSLCQKCKQTLNLPATIKDIDEAEINNKLK